ncbi:membrane protein [Candidatus Pseudothioglobus singularis PS1]|uniref:Membrane protein n=2 Tax=Candidatus Pseudothioglobus TaxID=2841677 RepID=A0A0M4M2K0_9GAMM|nr:membrane protein [Candidatus Pseudothioglobus singularis PS1]
MRSEGINFFTMNENSITPSDVLDYWFSEKSKQFWFASTPQVDNEIKVRFESVWEKAAEGEYSQWRETADGSVALIVILDQLPLNMFRSDPKGFQTESMAVEVALNAINNGFDEELNDEKLLFLFMPLMHSENIDHQNLQVYLFDKYNFNLEFSKHHRDLVKKFGRFPHRNEILGRMSTMEELDYLLSDNAFKG